MQNYCVIRPDLLAKELGVPVGLGHYRLPEPLEYRWVNGAGFPDDDGEEFQVLLDGEWQEAQSIDFDFIPSNETRVIVEVRGGIVQCVHSTDQNLKIVIVDYDKQEDGESPVSEVLSPDATFQSGYANELFLGDDSNASRQVVDQLKAIKF